MKRHFDSHAPRFRIRTFLRLVVISIRDIAGRATVAILATVLCSTSAFAKLDCDAYKPQGKVSNDIKASAKAKAKTLGKIVEADGELRGRYKNEEESLIRQFPNADQLLLKLALIHLTCEVILNNDKVPQERKEAAIGDLAQSLGIGKVGEKKQDKKKEAAREKAKKEQAAAKAAQIKSQDEKKACLARELQKCLTRDVTDHGAKNYGTPNQLCDDSRTHWMRKREEKGKYLTECDQVQPHQNCVGVCYRLGEPEVERVCREDVAKACP